MNIVLKIAIALIVLLAWQILSGDLAMACILGGFILVILVANPKKDKSYEDSDEYRAMVKEKNERKLFLEEERILEKQEAAQKQEQSKLKADIKER